MSLIKGLQRFVGSLVFQFITTTSAPNINGSLNGKLAIVTGGNSGIGFETAKGLALRGCKVIILCRNFLKAEIAMAKINNSCSESGSSGQCTFILVDLADLISVKACIQDVLDSLNKESLDFLVCNAGIMLQPYSVSPQGCEIHFATNHLGHVGLVIGLLQKLLFSNSKVVIVTGDMCWMENDASHDFKYDYIGIDSYCRSKICNQSFALRLQKLYPELKVYLVHPGIINSNLVSIPPGIPGQIESFLRPLVLINSEKGAQSTLRCLVTDDIPCGVYYHNCFGICAPHPRACDQKWSDNLWNLSIEFIGKVGIHLI